MSGVNRFQIARNSDSMVREGQGVTLVTAVFENSIKHQLFRKQISKSNLKLEEFKIAQLISSYCSELQITTICITTTTTVDMLT